MIAPPIVETALTRLKILAEQSPELAEAVDFYQRLIPALSRASAGIPPLAIPTETFQMKYESGVPLLVGEELDIDPDGSRVAFLAICSALIPPGGNGPRASALRRIISHVESGSLEPLLLLSAVEEGQTGHIMETAAQLGLDPQLLDLIAQNTLKAYLRAWRAGLENQIDLHNWQQSRCPICGSPPGLAEAQGVDRSRYLRCLRCGAGWPYPNLACARCGNEQHFALGILYVESELQKYYAHTCDQCKSYIKTLITFEPTPVDLLIVEDLATLHLDRLAAERGYH